MVLARKALAGALAGVIRTEGLGDRDRVGEGGGVDEII